jgi:hypothetical protein
MTEILQGAQSSGAQNSATFPSRSLLEADFPHGPHFCFLKPGLHASIRLPQWQLLATIDVKLRN